MTTPAIFELTANTVTDGAHSGHSTKSFAGEVQGHPVAAMDRAVRLMGEAAHDIKSPLSAIREFLRSLGDGVFGPVEEFGRCAIADGVDQCDALMSLIDNMLHLDRLRSGIPAAQRQWLTPASIAASADAVLQTIAGARRIRIHWSGFDGSLGPVYGDSALLRRLLINLVGNAVAVSPEEGMVMVSLRSGAARGMVRLVVADSGPGMSAEKMRQVAVRGVSETGGTGLGLAIGRTIAALHFCHLSVASSPGAGTRIAMELPAGGPASVAQALSRWRERLAASKGDSALRVHFRAAGDALKGLRIDLPQSSQLASANTGTVAEIEFPFDGAPPRYPGSAVAVGLRIDARSHIGADGIDTIVQRDQQMHELVYRTDARRWVFLWDNNFDEATRRCTALERRIREAADVGGLTWSPPVEQSIGQRSDRALLGDILVRDALHASSRAPRMDDRQGRTMQPTPAADDDVAARRLDEELKRLNPLMRRQSARMQEQAARLAAAMGAKS